MRRYYSQIVTAIIFLFRPLFSGFRILPFLFFVIFHEVSFAQAGPDSLAVKDSVITPPSSTADSALKNTPPPSPIPAATGTTGTPKAEAHSNVLMVFIKEKVENRPDSAYFNILKITNNNGSVIQGVVKIAVPRGWKLFSQEATTVSVAPGVTEYIPIRVSMDRKVTGGTSYIISATLLSDRSLFAGKNQTSVSKSCYITIPQERKWEMYPVQRTQYFDRYSDFTPLKLRLSNKGNGIEVVKLDFEIGSSLHMYGTLGNRYFTSISLKPHRDTVISFPVKYLPSDESDLWNRDFRKLSVRITASSDSIIKRTSVNFKYLESDYYNLLYDRITPLTLEFGLQNLLSTSPPAAMVAAYGTIFFKNDDALSYNLRVLSIPFSGYQNQDLGRYFWQRSRMLATYRSKRWEVQLGDINGYGSGLIGMFGRGVGGHYDINDKNQVGAAFTAALGMPIYSGMLFHQILLPKSLSIRTSLNAIADNYNRLNSYAGSVMVSYPILRGHYLSLGVAPSMTQHNFNNQSFLDVNGNPVITNDPGITRYGLASQLSYQFSANKLSGGLNAFWASRKHLQFYNGRLNINGNVQYILNSKYSLVANSGIYLNDPYTFNKGVLFPENKFWSGVHRVDLVGKMTNKITLFAGPMLEHFSFTSVKYNYATLDTTTAYFNNISPKLSLRCSYKNSASGFITPYAIVGYTYVMDALDSTVVNLGPYIPKNAFFNARAGVNIIQRNWGLNVFYFYGPNNFNTQTDYYYYGHYSKSIRVMPFFQRYYFNKKMLFSSYNSYFYDVLTNNERVALNARFQFFLGNDWSFHIDNNLYLSSLIGTDGRKVFSRNYFLSLGVKKVFDIPQPQVKYYDLKVVCFRDLNGNKIKDDNEQGLADVVISIDKQAKMDSVTQRVGPDRGQFTPAEMVTDNFGLVTYYHIPEGEVTVNVFPLMNLKDVFILGGQKQKVTVTRDTTFYVPFAQSYRVIGSIILNRDEFSSEGPVSVSNVRITATDSLGNSFMALTTNDGSYTLYVPQAGEYKVTVNNVFGDKFILQESEYTVSFDGAKEFQVDFIFNEKKRLVNMNGSATSLDTLLNRPVASIPTPTPVPAPAVTSTVSPTPPAVVVNQPPKFVVAGTDTLKNVTMVSTTPSVTTTGTEPKQKDSSIPAGPGITYRIQLAASSKQVPPSQYEIAFKDIKDIQEYSESGVYKYTAGDVNSVEEAQKVKADVRSKGFKDAFIVPFYKGSRVRY